MSHRHISFVKSAVRILGYVLLPLSIGLAAGVLVFSEVLGILEEVGPNGR